jgi:hypothetical protein
MAGMSPPNPNARRRNARPASMTLPAAGRKGATPTWPLPENLALTVRLEQAQETVDRLQEKEHLDAAEKRKLNAALEQVVYLPRKMELAGEAELALWKELWRSPQAVAWVKIRCFREVAQYARWKVLAEQGDLDAAKEARQLSDRLGLSPLAMLRLQWQIADDAVVAPRASGADSTVTDMASRRSRLTG